MEPLSSFAISIAAGVVLEMYPAIKTFRRRGVDRQIKVAFDSALKDWSPNESVRTQKEREIKSLLQSHIEQRDIINTKIVKQDTLDFLSSFEKRLAEHTQAYDFLKSIIDQQQHDEVVIELSTIKEQLSEIHEEIKKGNIDARDVGDWLDKIDFEEGQEKAIEIIQNWYSQKEIELELREVLLLATKKIYERTNELTQEIKELKSQGNTYLASVLEQIKNAVKERKPASLTAIYKTHLQKEKKEKIELLEELIDSSKAIFAYEEVIQFYNELLKINNSAGHHFHYGCFLQESNFFEEAIIKFKSALRLYEQSSEKELSIIADALNRIAVIHSFQNETILAIEYYEKSLKIRKFQSKKENSSYQLEMAMILNNLGGIYSHNNFDTSNRKYKDALKILKQLVKKKPRKKIYLENLALTLNNLAILYEQKNDFNISVKYYKESLKIRKVLADNDQFFLPSLSIVLNNLGSLYRVNNQFLIAKEYCAQALEIRRKLIKRNRRKYLPNLANTLYNIAVCNKFLGENSLAYKQYEESFEIYKSIFKGNPKTHGIEYARTLIVKFQLFDKNTKYLERAKEILQNFLKIHEAQNLLKMIDDLEKGD